MITSYVHTMYLIIVSLSPHILFICSFGYLYRRKIKSYILSFLVEDSLSLISLESFRERESSFVRCRILSGDLVARVSGLTPASGGSHSTDLAGLCLPCVGLYLR